MSDVVVTRTLELGKVDYNGNGRKDCPVTVELRIKRTPKGPALSIQGNIWMPSRRDIYSGGQNYDTLAELFPENETVKRLVPIWRRWHLNDMRPGCEHQRAERWRDRPIDPSKPTNAYGVFVPGVISTWNMLTWVTPEEHPEGLLTKACPTCGYRYGTAWLFEVIPAEVWDELTAIFGNIDIPDSE